MLSLTLLFIQYAFTISLENNRGEVRKVIQNSYQNVANIDATIRQQSMRTEHLSKKEGNHKHTYFPEVEKPKSSEHVLVLCIFLKFRPWKGIKRVPNEHEE